MPGGKKGNKKGGGDGGKKQNETKPNETKPNEPKPAGEPKQEEPAFKFNFGGGESGKQPTFDFGGKDSALLPLMQKKLNSLIGKPSGYFESLPAPIQNRIKALKSLHRKKAEYDIEYKKELKALQEKFDKLIDPLYARRKILVTGAEEPTEEEMKEEPKPEVEKEENKEEKSEEKTEPEEEFPADVKGVPNFWLETFKHHGDFTESISKNDEKALKYLTDVRCKSLPPAEHQSDQSFVLEFEFEDNPYFSNKALTKTYFLTDHEQIGETTFDHMEGCNIDWKPGKNLTVKLVQVQSGGGKRGGGRKGRGKGRSGGGKMITVEEPCESFFNFFKSDVAAAFGITEEDEEMEDGDLGELFEVDYEMGLAVKEQIIASAVLWFTGEIEDPFGEDEEDEDEEGEDGEYDSAEDPDFELDPNAPQSEQKPECAQQ